MKNKQYLKREQAIKELFEMVYDWGIVRIKVDYTNKVFRDQLIKVLNELDREEVK